MAKRVDKPIRLYVMTIFIVIAYCVLPLTSVFPFTGGFLAVGPRPRRSRPEKEKTTNTANTVAVLSEPEAIANGFFTIKLNGGA